MKYGLETTDAWLDALSTTWKRAAWFWLFVAGIGVISSTLLGDSHDMGDVLLFGGLTFVVVGPVFIWSTLTAAVVWIRFVHLENAGTRSFLLLGTLVAINGALDERTLESQTLVGLQILAFLLIVLTLLLSRSPDTRTGKSG